jgi:nucleotide-binding universal stress UspA family protein
MTTVIVATDGSDLAMTAAVAGLSLARQADKVLVVAVADLLDSSLTQDATGHAAASMTPAELESHNRKIEEEGNGWVQATAEALRNVAAGSADIDTRVIDGDPGPALCQLAAEVGASALIVGSRGRGGIRRALLGSVSDYIVRNGPCSVIVSREVSTP